MSDLPPLDAPQAYVVVAPDDQRGPYTVELLIGEVLAGRLSDATPVWWPGLPDWTTMGGHPGLAAEIARRRDAAAAPAPAWAPDPAAPSTAPEPTYEAPASYEAPAAAYDSSATYGAGAYDAPASYDAPQQGGYEAAQPSGFEAPAEQANDYIEVDAVAGSLGTDEEPVAATSEVDDETRRTFDAFVARSADLVGGANRAATAEEELVQAAIGALTDAGYTPAGRDVVDGSTELRFDSSAGDASLQVSLGRFGELTQDELPDAVIPLRMSASSISAGGGASTTTGEHGEIRVVADEWSGRSTASVELVLGLADYLDDRFGVDRDAVSRDLTAIAAVVRSRLG